MLAFEYFGKRTANRCFQLSHVKRDLLTLLKTHHLTFNYQFVIITDSLFFFLSIIPDVKMDWRSVYIVTCYFYFIFLVLYWNFCLLIFFNLFFNFLSADCGHNSAFVTAFTECSSLVSRKSFGFVTITWLILWKPTGQFVVLVAVSQLFTSMYSQRCQPLEI